MRPNRKARRDKARAAGKWARNGVSLWDEIELFRRKFGRLPDDTNLGDKAILLGMFLELPQTKPTITATTEEV